MKKSNVFKIIIYSSIILILLWLFYKFNYLPLLDSWFVDFKTNYQASYNYLNAPDLLYAIVPYNGGYTYPPIVSMVYSIFYIISNNFETAKLLWIFINYSVLILIIVLVYKFYYTKIDVKFFLLTLFIVFFKPLRDNLKYGNIKLILLFLFILLHIFYDKKKYIWAGIVYGFLIVLSVQPIILSFYFLIKKKYKFLIVAFCAVIILMFLAVAGANNKTELFYQTQKYIFVVVPNLFFEGASAAPYIQSIDAMCKRLFLDYNEYTIELFKSHFLALKLPIIIKLFFVVYTLALLYKNRKCSNFEHSQLNLIFLMMVLIHSINWEYHYTILIFSLLLIIKDYTLFENYRIPLFLMFFIIFLPIPYDNKIFLNANILQLFVNIKLFALCAIWYIVFKKIRHCVPTAKLSSKLDV
ncbi:MAG TPA: glycosyltransferase family 87 protein [bacterium]|nr:glycosyltransferase family 87 protein [bacterium]HPP86294.1 glycosyltransferase family 87 protein [bacterium]